jgi:hypothetical protein
VPFRWKRYLITPTDVAGSILYPWTGMFGTVDRMHVFGGIVWSLRYDSGYDRTSPMIYLFSGPSVGRTA